VNTLQAVERGRERARDVRGQHDLGTAPLADVFRLAEDVGQDLLVLARPLEDGPEGALMRGAGRWLIVVNTSDRTLSRQRFTALHELGHYYFDSHREPLHVDVDAHTTESEPEVRASSFAGHLLLPVEVLRERVRERRLCVTEEASLVRLALEYGIGMLPLSYQLRNARLVSVAQGRRVASIPALRVAARLGLRERILAEQSARGTVRLPEYYLSLGARAHAAGSVTDAWLGVDELGDHLSEAEEQAQITEPRP
jgi:hypothetical protein